MNKYIKMFMDDHNLKVGDEFRKNGTDAYGIWHFDEDGCLINQKGDSCNIVLVNFLLGEYEVEKVINCWKPKLDEKYWFVSNYGHVWSSYNDNDEDDKYILTHYPIFQTEEEAKDHKWFLDKVDEYKKPFILGRDNYFIYYNHEDKKVRKTYVLRNQDQGTIYFGNEENIKKFLEEVGEDRIEKYWFNIFEADE